MAQHLSNHAPCPRSPVSLHNYGMKLNDAGPHKQITTVQAGKGVAAHCSRSAPICSSEYMPNTTCRSMQACHWTPGGRTGAVQLAAGEWRKWYTDRMKRRVVNPHLSCPRQRDDSCTLQDSTQKTAMA
jgi:hypothetical protein